MLEEIDSRATVEDLGKAGEGKDGPKEDDLAVDG